MDKNVVIVLGMHRSGTSLLTGCLEEAGLYLGDIEEKYNPHNSKGQKEQIFLMELHEEVFKSNGGSWDLPPYKIKWRYFHNKAREHFITSMGSHSNWGFKDPRVLFLLDKWIEDIPHAKMIGIFRDPLAVASSLHARNRMSYNQGLDIWYRYNNQLLKYYKKYKFPIIEFISDTNKMNSDIGKICLNLGLRQQVNFEFLDQQLISKQLIQIKLPLAVKRMYEKLQSLQFS